MVKDEGKIGQIFLPVTSATIESIVNKTEEGFPRLLNIDRPYRRDSKGQRETNTPFLTIFKMTVVYTLGERQAAPVV